MDTNMTGFPGVEPRAWWSPTCGYFVLRWAADEDGRANLWIEAIGQPGTAPLPGDAHLIGAHPTQWAYDRVVEAAHQHSGRADNLAGRLEALRLKVVRDLGLSAGTVVEAAVDAALNRALTAPVAPPRPVSWEQAQTRLAEIARLRADEGEVSMWSLVRRAMDVAVNDADLYHEVVELAGRVNVELSEDDRSPSWMKS